VPAEVVASDVESALYLAVWAWSVGDEVYRREWPGSVLDVGAGDGLALLPALGGQRMRVGVVEPSAALLAETTAGLERLGVVHESWRVTAQEFVAAHAGRWDVVQSSFALQSLCEADKREVLSWICGHASRFVLVEFDVPEVDDVWDPVWFAGCVARLERGLREHGADRDLVGVGFVLPVVLGTFSATSPPANHEVGIQVCRVADYWWRPAYAVEAIGSS
jgi:hypothetical protein